MIEHVVVKDETLSKIAKKYYGDKTLYPELADANGIPDPTAIEIGLKIQIPQTLYRKIEKKSAGKTTTIRYQPFRCIFIPIDQLEINSLSFLSDHQVMKDYTADWDDGGALYSKPDWLSSNANPVSHTKNKKVKVKLKLTATPPNASVQKGRLKGTGPDGLEFDTGEISFKAGNNEVTLESKQPLTDKINEISFKINWTLEGLSSTITPAETENMMFITMGKPTAPARNPGITFKRLRQAVSAVALAGSNDPHAIVKFILGRWGVFNLDIVYDNAWELADDTINPVTGTYFGADCQTIVRYTENIIKMVGCPGTSKFVVVWAKVPTPVHGECNAAYKPNVSDPKQWFNDYNPRDPAKALWRATLLDGDDRHNRYEACLEFEHGGNKKYYAGGVGEKASPDEVILVFKSLSWKHDTTGIIMGDIHIY
jgi:hypothetical protein